MRLNVEQGYITEAKIYGDFFGLGEIQDVENALVGTKYAKEDLRGVIETIDVKKYFGNIEKDELLNLIY